MFAKDCIGCPHRAFCEELEAEEREEIIAAIAIVTLLDAIGFPRDGIIVIERVQAPDREEGTAAHRRDTLNV